MKSAPAPPHSEPTQALGFGFRTGGYALVMAAILVAAVVVWRVSQWGPAAQPPPELDLTTCRVPRETLQRGAPHGAIPRMTKIRTLSASEADGTKIRRGKFLVKGDLVIGVAIGEEAVAYPLRFLVWHEVINHEQGGVPLTISYGPWDGGAGVFDRRPLRPDGTRADAPLTFAPSGMLSNSAQLLQDEPKTGPPSLWSPLQARAVTGPAADANLTLARLPAEVLRWEDWRELHPETRVLAHDDQRLKLYGRSPYSTYRGSDLIRFPVAPLPPAGLPRKAAILAVRVGASWKVYPVDRLVAAAKGGTTEVAHGEQRLRFRAWDNGEKPATAQILDPVDEVVRAYWFAWYAARKDARDLGL
ncbi:MAG: DUF3179 domain-containing protein [Planctomycetes bacterium]|nr:DUF3179 domain-containing protein [Planctomycetota bacterium]